ncbi:chemotaxis protein CheW [Natronolimnohabitans innermongolicus]|uniref:Chemotaxis protein CheW n=1 Tax=Natronolimnohabitans innermongolicus JCM 12255 TaxID=1227499 RepID=L9WIC4_9EURY|nr:chemotaxis protein CheW [Natronolimnohabitans innermongolicus]ELY49199.1 chemotaxis protein CheW [Natronolimnohabitans innermongolicus JCM 12255]
MTDEHTDPTTGPATDESVTETDATFEMHEPNATDGGPVPGHDLELTFDETGGERMPVHTGGDSLEMVTEVDTVAADATKLLYFELNGSTFAVDLTEIASVETLSGLTRYPRAPAPIDGVTDLRGQIIAVLNPKVVLEIPIETDRLEVGNDYVIVAEEFEDEHRIGIRVDSIDRVESCTDDRITPADEIDQLGLLGIPKEQLVGIVQDERDGERVQIPWLRIDALAGQLQNADDGETATATFQ